MKTSLQLRCGRCGTEYDDRAPLWRCRGCDGPLEVVGLQPFPADRERHGVWRYPAATGLRDLGHAISLGEQRAPTVEDRALDAVTYRLEYLSPTGSYKDRGVAALVSKAAEWGVEHVVEDSSGNAGASVAAYSAAAGITATVVVPANTSRAKRAQIEAFGADLRLTSDRTDAAGAAEIAEQLGATYVGHNWSPYFLAGLSTIALEIFEQYGPRLPDWIVAPVGAGTLLLGVHRGMQMLAARGCIAALPRLLAVQSTACSPIVDAWHTRATDVTPCQPVAESVAEGIAIAAPVRGTDVLAAVRESDGACVAVTDDQILHAANHLARQGVLIETTSATALAGLLAGRANGSTSGTALVILTGNGLKTIGNAPRDIDTRWTNGASDNAGTNRERR